MQTQPIKRWSFTFTFDTEISISIDSDTHTSALMLGMLNTAVTTIDIYTNSPTGEKKHHKTLQRNPKTKSFETSFEEIVQS